MIEKLDSARAIAERVSRLEVYSDDMGTKDYRAKFHEDVENANEAFVDEIYYQVKEALEALEASHLKRNSNKE